LVGTEGFFNGQGSTAGGFFLITNNLKKRVSGFDRRIRFSQ
jgi:hypothetical protein